MSLQIPEGMFWSPELDFSPTVILLVALSVTDRNICESISMPPFLKENVYSADFIFPIREGGVFPFTSSAVRVDRSQDLEVIRGIAALGTFALASTFSCCDFN